MRDPVPEGEAFLRAVVLRRQLIESIYSALHGFARSPDYRKHEWEIETLSERLERLLPGSGEGRVIEHLIRLGREELGKALFTAAPSYIVSFPDVPDKEEELRRFAEFALASDIPEASENTDRLAHQLYASLQSAYTDLPDALPIYPAHGPGSPCGAGILERDGIATLGIERQSKPAR